MTLCSGFVWHGHRTSSMGILTSECLRATEGVTLDAKVLSYGAELSLDRLASGVSCSAASSWSDDHCLSFGSCRSLGSRAAWDQSGWWAQLQY